MEKHGHGFRAAAVSLAICMLCVGLVTFGTGCPQPPVPECTASGECDDTLYCNGAETCVDGTCQDGTGPCDEAVECDEDNDVCVSPGCQSAADCADGEFCNTQSGECVLNENQYAVIALDKADVGGDFDTVHPLHTECTACHHTEPAAGFQSCRTAGCHADDPDGINSFKDVAHDQNDSGDGCRACHAAEWDDCAFCHILLNGL